MQKKAALFCAHGLGDGLIFCIIAHNLYLNGYQVDVFHPFLQDLQDYFPQFSFFPHWEKNDTAQALSQYDYIIINKDQQLLHSEIVPIAKLHYPQKTYVLMPSTCKKKHLPGDFSFNQKIPIGKNLQIFSNQKLELSKTTCSNGMQYSPKKYTIPYIVIHPTSSMPSRNWPAEKFVQLAKKLQKKGFFPIFVVMDQEKRAWQWIEKEGVPLFAYQKIADLIDILLSARAMIGNDSGVAHLASSCGIYTITICSTHRKAQFWSPCWKKSIAVYPISFLLNIKGLRLRDLLWKKLVSVRKVYRALREIL